MTSIVDERTLEACFGAAPFGVEIHDVDDERRYANGLARAASRDPAGAELRAALRASVRASGSGSEVTLNEQGRERAVWIGPLGAESGLAGTVTMERDLGEGLLSPGLARAALSAAPALIAVFRGPSHVYDFVNARFEETFPSFAGQVGRSVAEHRGDLVDEHFLARLDHVFQTGEADEALEVPIVLPGEGDRASRTHYVSFVYQPLRDARQQVVGVIGYGFDVTDAVLARRQVEDASRAKDELLVTLSHELRTPLNAIVGWTHLVRTDALDEQQQRRAMVAIDRSARTQTRLLDDVLDYARIASDTLTIAELEFDLADLVRNEVATLQRSERDKQISFEVPAEPIVVRGDSERLRQVLLDVVGNSLKVTGPRGRIAITLARDGQEAALTVADDGVGIDAAQLPFVFERYRYPDGVIPRRHGGLGLGLAIVRALVLLHNGRIDVESEGLGLGATVRIHLPLV